MTTPNSVSSTGSPDVTRDGSRMGMRRKISKKTSSLVEKVRSPSAMSMIENEKTIVVANPPRKLHKERAIGLRSRPGSVQGSWPGSIKSINGGVDLAA